MFLKDVWLGEFELLFLNDFEQKSWKSYTKDIWVSARWNHWLEVTSGGQALMKNLKH